MFALVVVQGSSRSGPYLTPPPQFPHRDVRHWSANAVNEITPTYGDASVQLVVVDTAWRQMAKVPYYSYLDQELPFKIGNVLYPTNNLNLLTDFVIAGMDKI